MLWNQLEGKRLGKELLPNGPLCTMGRRGSVPVKNLFQVQTQLKQCQVSLDRLYSTSHHVLHTRHIFAVRVSLAMPTAVAPTLRYLISTPALCLSRRVHSHIPTSQSGMHTRPYQIPSPKQSVSNWLERGKHRDARLTYAKAVVIEDCAFVAFVECALGSLLDRI
ncbi:hypothetical protein K491DRAFT_39150 [Lophiostoma macrostomum CBS 122681]|uniref:Uncharacterized protein n=1 Tax=Lophiostoma macrostomum CBS 122681 TaxID=1314788 RepID=A0A6A6TN66_9PLEO|nr:hypothetical protein K491DRAFT_39150 [Lophiostoma macrostomum CBS 122681]